MENQNTGMSALLVARLVSRRRSLGLTLRELAPKLGMAFTGLSDLERGTRQLGVDRLVEWAAVLGWTVHIDLEEQAGPRDEARMTLRNLAQRAAELLDDDEVRTLTTVLRMALASNRQDGAK